MTDRELLEAAAKAAGMDLLPDGRWPRDAKGWFYNDAGGNVGLYEVGRHHHTKWNPLESDGDALRLAVKLGLDLTHHRPKGFMGSVYASDWDGNETGQDYGSDPYAATRRAIVRAAASLDESKEGSAA